MSTESKLPSPLKVLLVEDSESDAKLLVWRLRHGGFDPTIKRVETGKEMTDALASEVFDVVISDYRLPEFSGPAALALLREACQDVPFIIVSGTVGEENAVAAMKAGAHDYVMKDNLLRLVPAIGREIKEAQGRRDRRRVEIENERVRHENDRLLREIAAVAIQQQAFLSDVLYSVTEGKLILCNTKDALPSPFFGAAVDIAISVPTLRQMRSAVGEIAAAKGFSDERAMDLVTAVGEAAMNAAVHGGGGVGRVYASDDVVQVWIEDSGIGIDLTHLPRATLERGYTTRDSLGHGFFMILGLADRVHLLTSPNGTTVVIEQNRVRPEPVWMQSSISHADNAGVVPVVNHAQISDAKLRLCRVAEQLALLIGETNDQILLGELARVAEALSPMLPAELCTDLKLYSGLKRDASPEIAHEYQYSLLEDLRRLWSMH